MSKAARDTVLIIDDDPDLRTLIETVAEIYGVPILQAADCVNGLRLLEREQKRIKLIFLDYFVPGMDPAKCATAIVAAAGPNIPVVLLTAAADPASRAAELRISRWMAKPFDLSKLTLLLIQGALPNT